MLLVVRRGAHSRHRDTPVGDAFMQGNMRCDRFDALAKTYRGQ